MQISVKHLVGIFACGFLLTSCAPPNYVSRWTGKGTREETYTTQKSTGTTCTSRVKVICTDSISGDLISKEIIRYNCQGAYSTITRKRFVEK